MIENHQTNIELDLVDSSNFDPASDGYLVLVTRVDDLVDNTNDNKLVAERVVQVEFKFDVTPDDEIVCNGQVVPSGSSVLEVIIHSLPHHHAPLDPSAESDFQC